MWKYPSPSTLTRGFTLNQSLPIVSLAQSQPPEARSNTSAKAAFEKPTYWTCFWYKTCFLTGKSSCLLCNCESLLIHLDSFFVSCCIHLISFCFSWFIFGLGCFCFFPNKGHSYMCTTVPTHQPTLSSSRLQQARVTMMMGFLLSSKGALSAWRLWFWIVLWFTLAWTTPLSSSSVLAASVDDAD